MERKGFLLEEGAKYFIRLFFKKKKIGFQKEEKVIGLFLY